MARISGVAAELGNKPAISVAVNIAISFLLTLPFGYIGVALGAMVSAWVNAILLGSILYRRGLLVLDARSKRTLPRLLLACIGPFFAARVSTSSNVDALNSPSGSMIGSAAGSAG